VRSPPPASTGGSRSTKAPALSCDGFALGSAARRREAPGRRGVGTAVGTQICIGNSARLSTYVAPAFGDARARRRGGQIPRWMPWGPRLPTSQPDSLAARCASRGGALDLKAGSRDGASAARCPFAPGGAVSRGRARRLPQRRCSSQVEDAAACFRSCGTLAAAMPSRTPAISSIGRSVT
jgi:hypothetical protein